MSIILKSGDSADLASVDANKRLKINLPMAMAEAGYSVIAGESHDGANGEPRLVRAAKVAAQVEAALKNLAINDPELMTAAIAAVKDANKAKQESHNREVGALKKEHTDIQAKLDRLVDLLAEGVLPPDDYRVKREQYKTRQHELVSLIHAYDDADNTFGSTMEKLMKVAMGAHKAFMSSNVEEKRELLNFVFANLQLKGATLCYELRKPFDKMLNQADCIKWWRGCPHIVNPM